MRPIKRYICTPVFGTKKKVGGKAGSRKNQKPKTKTKTYSFTKTHQTKKNFFFLSRFREPLFRSVFIRPAILLMFLFLFLKTWCFFLVFMASKGVLFFLPEKKYIERALLFLVLSANQQCWEIYFNLKWCVYVTKTHFITFKVSILFYFLRTLLL